MFAGEHYAAQSSPSTHSHSIHRHVLDESDYSSKHFVQRNRLTPSNLTNTAATSSTHQRRPSLVEHEKERQREREKVQQELNAGRRRRVDQQQTSSIDHTPHVREPAPTSIYSNLTSSSSSLRAHPTSASSGQSAATFTSSSSRSSAPATKDLSMYGLTSNHHNITTVPTRRISASGVAGMTPTMHSGSLPSTTAALPFHPPPSSTTTSSTSSSIIRPVVSSSSRLGLSSAQRIQGGPVRAYATSSSSQHHPPTTGTSTLDASTSQPRRVTVTRLGSASTEGGRSNTRLLDALPPSSSSASSVYARPPSSSSSVASNDPLLLSRTSLSNSRPLSSTNSRASSPSRRASLLLSSSSSVQKKCDDHSDESEESKMMLPQTSSSSSIQQPASSSKRSTLTNASLIDAMKALEMRLNDTSAEEEKKSTHSNSAGIGRRDSFKSSISSTPINPHSPATTTTSTYTSIIHSRPSSSSLLSPSSSTTLQTAYDRAMSEAKAQAKSAERYYLPNTVEGMKSPTSFSPATNSEIATPTGAASNIQTPTTASAITFSPYSSAFGGTTMMQQQQSTPSSSSSHTIASARVATITNHFAPASSSTSGSKPHSRVASTVTSPIISTTRTIMPVSLAITPVVNQHHNSHFQQPLSPSSPMSSTSTDSSSSFAASFDHVNIAAQNRQRANATTATTVLRKPKNRAASEFGYGRDAVEVDSEEEEDSEAEIEPLSQQQRARAIAVVTSSAVGSVDSALLHSARRSSSTKLTTLKQPMTTTTSRLLASNLLSGGSGSQHSSNPPSSVLSSTVPLPLSSSTSHRLRGLSGLQNLGNTCFLNSSLQCLFSTPGMMEYFSSGRYEGEIHEKGSMKTRGMLARAFGTLAKKMAASGGSDHDHYSIERPSQIKQAMGLVDSQFLGYSQHDSHEFTRVLLSALHDDLNRIQTKVKYVEIVDKEGDTSEVISKRWWENYTERNNSIITDCFSGQLQSILVCQSCERRSEAYDPFMDLSLPIPKLSSAKGGGLLKSLFGGEPSPSSRTASTTSSSHVSRCTLQDCFTEFLRSELLSHSEQVYCRQCKTHRNQTKVLSVWRWPRILVLHLKRFSFSHHGHTRSKLNTDVDFPMELDCTRMQRCSASGGSEGEKEVPAIYDLYGVSNHLGSAGGGHYTAHCRVSTLPNSPFYNFNDSSVHEISNAQVRGPSAYVLFYRRRGHAADNPSDKTIS